MRQEKHHEETRRPEYRQVRRDKDGRIDVQHMKALYPGFEPLLPAEQIAPSRRSKPRKPPL
jgi:hypothetical protein